VTRVEAPSRLHFGILSPPIEGREYWPGLQGHQGLPIRHYGGLGLMVDRPGVTVEVQEADEWSTSGLLGDRALTFARRIVDHLPVDEQRPFQITVDTPAVEHTGLGVGTQLGMAVTKAIAIETGHADWSIRELAERSGRGERSAIGIHGFAAGGLIVEGGKRPGEALSPLVGQYALPKEWKVLLCFPETEGEWHGQRERLAFHQLSRVGPSPHEIETLCRLVLMGMLPALAAPNLDEFGEALYEFNARVGDHFAPVQGGRYCSPAVAKCVERLRGRGIRGVGQSSWGPTVFAIVREVEAHLILKEIRDMPAMLTSPSAGASFERDPSSHRR
jgi:beta-ribofuranosylaminobenzene 5'-phosphate synthase